MLAIIPAIINMALVVIDIVKISARMITPINTIVAIVIKLHLINLPINGFPSA
jgi:hypothetical protein